MTRPILSADAMLAAEAAAIAAGTPVETLMERAGEALAEAVFQIAGNRPALVLCGPGNNGGDGYVAARHLKARGIAVRVAALAAPASAAAQWAKGQWDGPVETLADAGPAPVLVDCLFGTGLSRGLEAADSARLSILAGNARLAIACDLPSGVAADSGEIRSPIPDYALTVTFGALKPAHRLMPAMAAMGRVVLADIGIAAATAWSEIGRPALPPLDPAGHKYSRGVVELRAGEMPGAIALAASAAQRTGAGYVRLVTPELIHNVPSAVVQTPLKANVFLDPTDKAVTVSGPGRAEMAVVQAIVERKLNSVLDADALFLARRFGNRFENAILTPHGGEFDRSFRPYGNFAPILSDAEAALGKPERTLLVAERTGAVVVHKGPDTLVATPDGRLGFAPPAPAWLASAGTGDVLTGMIAALRARGMERFEAACAGVWLHGRAAELVGPSLIADDLVDAIPAVLETL
jgi:hydroxyethylthiazole kinase-like uncharacterized protein yjeF